MHADNRAGYLSPFWDNGGSRHGASGAKVMHRPEHIGHLTHHDL